MSELITLQQLHFYGTKKSLTQGVLAFFCFIFVLFLFYFLFFLFIISAYSILLLLLLSSRLLLLQLLYIISCTLVLLFIFLYPILSYYNTDSLTRVSFYKLLKSAIHVHIYISTILSYLILWIPYSETIIHFAFCAGQRPLMR